MRRIYAQKGGLRITQRNETGSGPFVNGAKRPVNRGHLNRGIHQQTDNRDSSKIAPLCSHHQQYWREREKEEEEKEGEGEDLDMAVVCWGQRLQDGRRLNHG